MNIFETLAASITLENGRDLFNSTHLYGGANVPSRFWEALVTAYGETLYELPKLYGVEPRASEYRFPAYSAKLLLRLGIAPETAFTMKSLTDFSYRHTPVSTAAALLHFAPDHRAEAVRLLDPKFLMQVHRDQKPGDTSVFFSNCAPNPWSPEDFKLPPISYESLKTPEGIAVIGSCGDMSWFDDEYTRHLGRFGNPSVYFSRTVIMEEMHGKWPHLVRRAAASCLSGSNALYDYKMATEYLRHSDPIEARHRLSRATGVTKLLWATLPDATTTEMAMGLKVLASNDTAPVQQALSFIGRPLTLEDFNALPPLAALRILHDVSYDYVADVIAKRSTELSARFITLTSREHLPLVTQCMSPHKNRKKSHMPPTPINGRRTPQEYRDEWNERWGSLIADHLEMRHWRDYALGVAGPAVVFLLLLKEWCPAQRIPLVAIDAALRTHHNATGVNALVGMLPKRLQRKEAGTA